MLIILSKPPSTIACSSIIEAAKEAAENGENVAVLHIQDACTAVAINEYYDNLAEHKIKVYALKADTEARGLTEKVSSKVKLIDYKQWVKLVMTEHKKIVSWTT